MLLQRPGYRWPCLLEVLLAILREERGKGRLLHQPPRVVFLREFGDVPVVDPVVVPGLRFAVLRPWPTHRKPQLRSPSGERGWRGGACRSGRGEGGRGAGEGIPRRRPTFPFLPPSAAPAASGFAASIELPP